MQTKMPKVKLILFSRDNRKNLPSNAQNLIISYNFVNFWTSLKKNIFVTNSKRGFNDEFRKDKPFTPISRNEHVLLHTRVIRYVEMKLKEKKKSNRQFNIGLKEVEKHELTICSSMKKSRFQIIWWRKEKKASNLPVSANGVLPERRGMIYVARFSELPCV